MFGQSNLSINTDSANALSGQSQPQPSGSLFGGTQPAGGLFASSSQQPSNNNMFNSSNQGTGPFGSQPNNVQAQQPQLGSSLLSGTQPQTRSLFTQPGQQLGGNISGTSNTQPNQSSLYSSSTLVGGSSSIFQNPPNPAQSQFLQQQLPQQLPQQLHPSIFATSIGQYSQQQQTVPGVRISLNELRPTTRFNDLHEELQKVIEYVDNFILSQIGFQEQCEQAMTRVEGLVAPIPNDVEYCAKTLETMQNALENDAEAIAHAKRLVRTDAANAKLSFKVIQNLKLPQQFQTTGLWNIPNVSQGVAPALSDDDLPGASSDVVSYFSKETDNMAKTLEGYKQSLAEVETYLQGIEANTFQQMQQMAFTQGQDGRGKSAEDQVRELAAALREFENGILGVASKVGGAREKVQEIMLGGDLVKNSGNRTRRY